MLAFLFREFRFPLHADLMVFLSWFIIEAEGGDVGTPVGCAGHGWARDATRRDGLDVEIVANLIT
jgi:hypothetical protein